MAVTLSYTVSDSDAAAVVDALCQRYGYQATILDASNNPIPNPEGRQAFAKRMIAEWMKSEVKSYRRWLAQQAENSADITVT